MPPPPPSPSLFLLPSLLKTYPPHYDGPNDIRGRVLTTGDKLAFGFDNTNDDANEVVRSLDLEAVLAGAPDHSFLILRGAAHVFTGIHTVDKDLVMIATAFTNIDYRQVLLIYSAVDRSLRMIPSMPHTYPPFRTALSLVARRRDNDESYALVFPGQMRFGEDDDSHSQDVLFVAHSSSASPWETVKRARVPTHSSCFVADVVFSCRGRGYWADLLVGIMYCDCGELISEATDCVNIHSLELPAGCDKYLGGKGDVAEARAFRAMGPSGDSVKFISIDGYLEPVDLKDCMVRVWRLVEDEDWAVEYELKLASLWDGVEFKGSFIPDCLTPMYPFLSTHEDHVIYFALGFCEQSQKIHLPGDVCFMVRVDMRSKTFDCRGLSPEQRKSMSSHVAVSSTAEGKLLGHELSAILSVN